MDKTRPSSNEGLKMPSHPTERQPLLACGTGVSTSLGLPNDGSDCSIGHVEELTIDSWSTSLRPHTTKIMAVMFNFFASGMLDAAVGSLIPDIEYFYDQTDGPTSLIFSANTLGYITAALSMEFIHVRLGRRGIALISPLCSIAGTFMLSYAPAFPIALVGYWMNGIGIGISDCGFCAWAAGLPYNNVAFGFLHGFYSAGCTVGPLVTSRLLRQGFPWFIFYLIMGFVKCIEFFVLVWAFREDSALSYEVAPSRDDKPVSNPFRLIVTWLAGIYFVVYIGVETSLTNWIVSFMLRVREVPIETASLALSMYWIGMGIGRVILGPVTEYFGVSLCVVLYILIAISMQIAFSFTVHIAGSLIILGTIGMFFGPVLPSAIVLVGKKLPIAAHVRVIAFTATMGQVGAAGMPMAIGFMSDKFGMDRMLDVVLLVSILMLLLWITFSLMREVKTEIPERFVQEEVQA